MKFIREMFEFEDGLPFEPPLAKVIKKNKIERRYDDDGRPYCTVDGCDKLAHNNGYKNQKRWRMVCHAHHRTVNERKTYCENEDGRLGFKCTTTIIDKCMLQVDHIDNDHTNDVPENVHTLCACCHHYKTKFFGRLTGNQVIDKMENYKQKFIDKNSGVC